MCFWESRRTMKLGTFTTCFLTRMCLCLMRTRAWWRLGKSKLEHLRLQPALQEVLDLEAENVVKLHSVVAEVSSSRAADLIRARLYFTRHTSRLFLRPYSPMSFSSWSRRAFSKGLLGVMYTLEYPM